MVRSTACSVRTMAGSLGERPLSQTGSGHPAGLNYGDCLSYPPAADFREPLLWTGDDFGHPGIRSASDE